MEEKQVLGRVSEAITDKPRLTLVVERKQYRWWHRLLRRPREKTFTIRPATVGTMYRVSGRAIQLHEELFKAITLQDGNASADVNASMRLIHAHLDDIVYIVAAVIQNNSREPKPGLQRFIRENFEGQDFFEALLPVLGSLNLQAFLNSIVLIKGTEGVLRPKASLKNPGEMIAPGA